MKASSIICLLASCAVATTSSVSNRSFAASSYSGYKVFRVKTGKQLGEVLDHLSQFSAEPWNSNIGSHVDVAIAPEHVPAFESLSLEHHELHADLGRSIARESAASSIYKRQVNDDAWFDSYHPYEDHIAFWNDLQAVFPNQSAIVSSGTSFEGRNIFGLHVWGSDGPGKPAILYHSTVHAREWITAMTTEYITRELINGYKARDSLSRSVLDSYDLYVLPVVNPDGFVFSQKTDRLWRKNRQPPPLTAVNQACFGRDNNRNWEVAWGANDRGASTDPCSAIYKGQAPLDSPENQGLNDLILKLRDEQGIKLYIDWHSYSQKIVYPSCYNKTLYPLSLQKWHKTAAKSAAAIRAASDIDANYTFGPCGVTVYIATGTALDHVYEVGGAEFAYTVELRDRGKFGFILPPEQIRPNVVEQWAGQKTMLSLLDQGFFDGEGGPGAILDSTIST